MVSVWEGLAFIWLWFGVVFHHVSILLSDFYYYNEINSSPDEK